MPTRNRGRAARRLRGAVRVGVLSEPEPRSPPDNAPAPPRHGAGRPRSERRHADRANGGGRLSRGAVWCGRRRMVLGRLFAFRRLAPARSPRRGPAPAVADGHNPDAFHGPGVLARSCAWALMPAPFKQAVRPLRPAPDRCLPASTGRSPPSVSLIDRVEPAPIDRRFPTFASGLHRAAMHPHGIYAWEKAPARPASWPRALGAAAGPPYRGVRHGCPGRAALVRAAHQARAAGRDVRNPAGRCPGRPSQAGSRQGAFRELQRLHEGSLTTIGAGRAPASSTGPWSTGAYREMVRMFAAGQDRYKVMAYRLWTLCTGDCVGGGCSAGCRCVWRAHERRLQWNRNGKRQKPMTGGRPATRRSPMPRRSSPSTAASRS